MVGTKRGTGARSVIYLRTTLDQRFFPELWKRHLSRHEARRGGCPFAGHQQYDSRHERIFGEQRSLWTAGRACTSLRASTTSTRSKRASLRSTARTRGGRRRGGQIPPPPQCHFAWHALLALLGAQYRRRLLRRAITPPARSRLIKHPRKVRLLEHLRSARRARRPIDIVYTSYGVLSWLPELDPWAEVIAHFLKPGGFFSSPSFTPFISMLATTPTPSSIPTSTPARPSSCTRQALTPRRTRRLLAHPVQLVAQLGRRGHALYAPDCALSSYANFPTAFRRLTTEKFEPV